MNRQNELNNILENSLILVGYSKEKTLTARAIQCAFRICYKNNKIFSEEGVSRGTKYVTILTCSHTTEFKKKIPRYTWCEKFIKNFLVNKNIRLSKGSIAYLCGILELLNDNEDNADEIDADEIDADDADEVDEVDEVDVDVDELDELDKADEVCDVKKIKKTRNNTKNIKK